MKFQYSEQQTDCLNCLASAGLFTALSGEHIIEGDALFFGIITYIHSQPFGQDFFQLLGLSKIPAIIQYSKQRYNIEEHIATTGNIGHTVGNQTFELRMSEPIQQQLIAYNTHESDNIIALFSIACSQLSNETRTRCNKSKVGLATLMKKLPTLVKRSQDIQMSTKQLFETLKELKQGDYISISELSNMDLVSLEMTANEYREESKKGLHSLKDQTINNQFTLLLTKLMDAITSIKDHNDPINKRYNLISNGLDTDEETIEPDGSHSSKSSIATTEKPETEEKKKMAVDFFGTDLTKSASKGELDPVIGREKEIDQIIYTLLRKTKNSPLLIGEAGVGKTAVVEGLAMRIISGSVPEKLKGYRVINLDITGMVAGTKYRGEFEQRLKSVLEEASDQSNQIILFIDELHTIMGAGGHDNNDMANSIKPMLSRGKIKLIGATTFDEYQKHIEKDAALKRRFQEINVNEPSGEDAISILEGLKGRFESFHDVNITPEAIQKAVGLSMRYILNKHLPDKAIDLLDEASARKSVLLTSLEHNHDFTKAQHELEVIDQQIQVAVEEQNYFKAASLKQEAGIIKDHIKLLRTKSNMPSHLRPTVDSNDIGNVLSDKLGIPTDIINESEIQKLISLKQTFDKQIFGQDEAVEKVIKSIQKSRLSIIPKNKPIASFLFLGPSGVGKTYIAKLIAEHYFHDPKSLIRIDMSEFMERYSVSKIIGSAPGYVGYDEGGSLTEQIRRKPYSVLLLDEIEKADKSVLNILLQILDEGQLKDSKGRIIDFKNTIIVMTSNIGSEYFSQQGKQIGFDYKELKGSNTVDIDHIKPLVIEKLQDHLLPELLNRIDHKLVFSPLNIEQLTHVFKKLYTQFKEQRSHNSSAIVPEFDDQQILQKVSELYNPQYGARPIEQYIYNELEDKVIESLLK
ncbi:MAG TPA: ATP-dependent Clp protease ATP-binding subunit [Candidatus Absconditabacterales bacterium]|nr:ATP-dependent Clp protease ATP-binding subunit [Candidatus Absconditabacterales bacterium]